MPGGFVPPLQTKAFRQSLLLYGLHYKKLFVFSGSFLFLYIIGIPIHI